MNDKIFNLFLDNKLNILKADTDFLEYIGQKNPVSLNDIVPPQDLLILNNTLFALNPGEGNLCCFRMRISTGKLNWNAANLQKTDEENCQIIMECEDIQSFRKVRDANLYDPMTGLYNKQSITEYAQEMVKIRAKVFILPFWISITSNVLMTHWDTKKVMK